MYAEEEVNEFVFDVNAPGAGDIMYAEEEDEDVIVISSDEEGEHERLIDYLMNIIPESPNLDYLDNNHSPETGVTTVTTLTTTTTTTSTTKTSSTQTTTTPLERCCICLTDIVTGGGGISLHHNIHSIHIFCLIDYLANSPIIWSGTSFPFHCPLCRCSVLGNVMMDS